MTEPISLTGLLAVYGAILSSIALGWNLYRDLHDRARLKVRAHARRIVHGDGRWYAVKPDLPVEGASEQLFVVVDVTNVGRRPVKWTGWGGKYCNRVNGKDSFTIVPIELPTKLNEGDSHSEFASELISNVENVKRLFVWDASGKNWYLPHRALTKLKAEVRETTVGSGTL